MINRNPRGDTIVEVVIAIAMFSIVAIGAQSLMNKSLATTRGDFEITLVRNQIDSQANALRYMHNSYIASYSSGGTPTTGPASEWKRVVDYVKAKGLTTASNYGLTAAGKCPAATTSSFIINVKKATMVSTASLFVAATTSSQVSYDAADEITAASGGAQGIWIEGVRVVPADTTQSKAAYIDFHIRTCWSTVGQDVPHTLGTIVRLYDPI